MEMKTSLDVPEAVADNQSEHSSTLRRFASALSIKNPTNVVMLATQLALRYTLERIDRQEWRDIIMQDFYIVNIHYFPSSGSKIDQTPSHPYNNFKFKDYSPIAFRFFRSFYTIKCADYVKSLCDQPLKELSASGASGSLFFKTADDLYVLKSVDEREADFLKRLLPAYYINIKQNLNTLLPKFFGLYVYSSIRQKIRICVMNNLLPSKLKLDEVYDLKGSTHKRRASQKELNKPQPTLKDLDFLDFHPQGFTLQEEYYKLINETLERDTRVLEGFEIMDYSLLVGIHNVSAHEATTCPCGTFKDTTRYDTFSKFNDLSYELRGLAIKTISENPLSYQGGLPALNQKGDKLLIFLGIIDILQNYRLVKRLEHNFKAIVNDGKTISVNNPTFYKNRFLNFCKTKVFHSHQKIQVQTNPLEFGESDGQVQITNPVENAKIHYNAINEEITIPSKQNPANSEHKRSFRDSKLTKNPEVITEQKNIEPEVSLEEKIAKSRTDSKGNSSGDEKLKFSSLEKQSNDELKISQSPPKSIIENVNRRSSNITLKGQEESRTIEENKRISEESREKTEPTLIPSKEPTIEDNQITKDQLKSEIFDEISDKDAQSLNESTASSPENINPDNKLNECKEISGQYIINNTEGLKTINPNGLLE